MLSGRAQPAKERRRVQMLSCSPAKLRLFVKSQKVAVGFTEFSRVTPAGPWTLLKSPVRTMVYDRVLDDEQAKLVAEARQLSRSTGLDLEVVDLGRMSWLRQMLLSRSIGRSLPVASSSLNPASRFPARAERSPEFEHPMKTI